MSRRRRAFSAVVLMLAEVLHSGCGPERVPTYPVKGRVIFKENGQPAAAGAQIWFESTQPPEYLRSMSAISNDGSFLLSTDREGNGSMAGEHRVRIDPTNSSGMNIEAELAKVIDRKYFEFRTSGLKVTVKEKEAHDFKIELDRPAGSAAR